LEPGSGGCAGDHRRSLLDRGAQDPRRGYTPFLEASLTRTDDGLKVAAVRERGAGDSAGLKPGDLLLSINGRPVADYDAVRRAVGAYAPGKAVALKVRRDGQELDLSLHLSRPAAPVAK